MINLRTKVFAAGFAGALALGSLGSAFAVSDNANQQACFGQGRAAFASTKPGGESQGFHSSQRKGENSTINAEAREACQSAP